MIAYTSTVVARGQLVVALGLAVTTGVPVALTGPWWTGLVCSVAILGCGWYLSVVRLSVGSNGVLVALGPHGRARSVPADQIVRAETQDATAAAVFGLDRRPGARDTRMIIRRGPALVLTLSSGETVRVSTADPDAAKRALRADERSTR